MGLWTRKTPIYSFSSTTLVSGNVEMQRYFSVPVPVMIELMGDGSQFPTGPPDLMPSASTAWLALPNR